MADKWEFNGTKYLPKVWGKIKQLWGEMGDLSWTLAGTGLVLITLSGDTLKWGIWMSVTALTIQLAVILSSKTDD
jgi:hypothetical protein